MQPNGRHQSKSASIKIDIKIGINQNLLLIISASEFACARTVLQGRHWLNQVTKCSPRMVRKLTGRRGHHNGRGAMRMPSTPLALLPCLQKSW